MKNKSKENCIFIDLSKENCIFIDLFCEMKKLNIKSMYCKNVSWDELILGPADPNWPEKY